MNSKWRLEELGKIVTGKTPPKTVKDSFSESGVLFLTPKDMDGRKWITSTERYLSKNGVEAVKNSVIPPGSIAVSCIGSDMGKAVMVPAQTVTNQQINTIIPDVEKCNPNYLYYLLSTKQQELKDIAGGSATPILNKGHFGKVQVYLPDLDYQMRASEILSAFDDKIDLNQKINKTLEQIAQAIFKSWFVDFEPVKAKVAVLEAGGSEEDAQLAAMQVISGKSLDELTRFQSEHPEQYAELCATAELFPAAMQDSELGEIPEGWEVSTIGVEVEVKGGGTPSTKNNEYWDGGDVHWTSPRDLSNSESQVMISTERKITKAGLAKISSGLLPVGTVLMSSRAPVGYLAMAKIPVAINQGYIAMICRGRFSSEYVIQWANSVMRDIQQRASGTTFAEISKKNFREIPMIVPSIELASRYSEIVGVQYSIIELNLRNSNNFSEIRDSLLPKLLSGELEV